MLRIGLEIQFLVFFLSDRLRQVLLYSSVSGGKSNNWGVNFNTRCRIKGVNLNSCQLSTTKNFRREAQWRSLMNFRHEDT